MGLKITRQEAFENWFLSIPDVDETLLKAKEGDTYKDEYVGAMYAGFCAGWSMYKSLNS